MKRYKYYLMFILLCVIFVSYKYILSNETEYNDDSMNFHEEIQRAKEEEKIDKIKKYSIERRNSLKNEENHIINRYPWILDEEDYLLDDKDDDIILKKEKEKEKNIWSTNKETLNFRISFKTINSSTD